MGVSQSKRSDDGDDGDDGEEDAWHAWQLQVPAKRSFNVLKNIKSRFPAMAPTPPTSFEDLLLELSKNRNNDPTGQAYILKLPIELLLKIFTYASTSTTGTIHIYDIVRDINARPHKWWEYQVPEAERHLRRRFQNYRDVLLPGQGYEEETVIADLRHVCAKFRDIICSGEFPELLRNRAFFRENTFRFVGADRLVNDNGLIDVAYLKDTLPKRFLSQIRSVEIGRCASDFMTRRQDAASDTCMTFDFLARLTGLKHVKIYFEMRQEITGGPRIPGRRFRFARDWRIEGVLVREGNKMVEAYQLGLTPWFSMQGVENLESFEVGVIWSEDSRADYVMSIGTARSKRSGARARKSVDRMFGEFTEHVGVLFMKPSAGAERVLPQPRRVMDPEEEEVDRAQEEAEDEPEDGSEDKP